MEHSNPVSHNVVCKMLWLAKRGKGCLGGLFGVGFDVVAWLATGRCFSLFLQGVIEGFYRNIDEQIKQNRKKNWKKKKLKEKKTERKKNWKKKKTERKKSWKKKKRGYDQCFRITWCMFRVEVTLSIDPVELRQTLNWIFRDFKYIDLITHDYLSENLPD